MQAPRFAGFGPPPIPPLPPPSSSPRPSLLCMRTRTLLTRAPVQLPYSKMLARAEQEGDELLAEYYRKEQQYVLANAERRTQRLKKNALMSGAKDSKWSRAMAEVGYVGPNSREKALATRLAAEEEAAQGAVEDNQPQKKKQQQ